MYGIMQMPNGSDNSLYISPIYVVEPQTYAIVRGRLRGLFHPIHYYQNFNDGAMFSGSLEYQGKTFMAIRQSYVGSVWLLETSPTVEVN